MRRRSIGTRSVGVLIVVSALGAGCGPTSNALWKAESDQTVSACNVAVSGMSGELGRIAGECRERLRDVDRRYGMPIDPVVDASWSYAMAVLTRVDRNELTREQARSLMGEFTAYLQFQRARAGAAEYTLAATERRALWDGILRGFRSSDEAHLRIQILCRAYSASRGFYTTCD